MEISDLVAEKYNKHEYGEILKLFCIRDGNKILIENLRKILNIQLEVTEALNKCIDENDTQVAILNDMFYENNKMFKHILDNFYSNQTSK